MYSKIIFLSIFPSLVFIGFNSQALGDNFAIEYNENGGECNVIGIWDFASKTCFMNRDLIVGDGLVILNTNGITLDGQGYHITKNGLEDGIYIGNSNNVKISNIQISNTRNGIFLNNSSDNIIANVTTVWNTENGIWLLNDSDNNTISDNLVGYSIKWGIGLGDADYNTISDNFITHTKDAIRLEASNHNIVSGNYVWDNRVEGIDLHESSNNLIYHNNIFEKDSMSLLDDCEKCASKYFDTNIGNYYQEYDENEEGCFDLNSDEICDEPYTFDYGIDEFPSVQILREKSIPVTSDFPLEFDNWGSYSNKQPVENNPTKIITDWKRYFVMWYYNDNISEQEFISGVEYLIQKEIIKIPSTDHKTVTALIPPEKKIELGLWAYGVTDDQKFIDIVSHLAEKGIIQS